MERIKLSTLEEVNSKVNIDGNFGASSVVGEYYIPSIGKTGFYKENGYTPDSKNDEDLRELFCSKIMEKIGFPHADIILAHDDENNRNGCLSVNILNEDEHFVNPISEYLSNPDIPQLAKIFHLFKFDSIDDFIKDDLEKNSSIQGITSEDLKDRKEYLLNYLFVSALVSNYDIKIDNRLMIKNDSTGEFRNSEYYDMAIGFYEDSHKFLLKFSANEIIQMLYKQYPSQIVQFGKHIEETLNEEDIDEMLNGDNFQGFTDDTKKAIVDQLTDRLTTIRNLNSREENKFKFGINRLHDVTKKVTLPLRDKVANYMINIKNKFLGRERND